MNPSQCIITAERLLECIGEIEDFFLEEAVTTDIAAFKAKSNMKIVRYGAAGLAVMAMAYWLFKPARGSKASKKIA